MPVSSMSDMQVMSETPLSGVEPILPRRKRDKKYYNYFPSYIKTFSKNNNTRKSIEK